jgi:hypothetical protein
MALEYRKFYLQPNQQAPEGNTGIGTGDGGVIWAGQAGTFPTSTYTSVQMGLHEVAQIHAAQIQTKTFEYIERYMPQWRLNRWRRYYDLRQKVLAQQTLNLVEQAEYDCFPDPTETHAQCDVYVGPVLKWCSDVVLEHNRVYFGIFAATNIENILSIKNSISYPPFLM